MPAHDRVVSHHQFRRTARKRARALASIESTRLKLECGSRRYWYTVEKAKRGPFGWYVMEARARPRAAGSPSPVAESEGLS